MKTFQLIAMAGLATSLTMGAYGQTTNNDNQNRNRYEQDRTQQDRTQQDKQDRRRTGDEADDKKYNEQDPYGPDAMRNEPAKFKDKDTERAWRDAQTQYFGAANGTDIARLDDLAGVWRMTITVYPESGDANEQQRGLGVHKMEGLAERRWALDGNLLVERYTMGGDRADLPLSTPGMELTSWRDHEDGWRGDMNRTRSDDMNRDRMNDGQDRMNNDRDRTNRDRDGLNREDPNRRDVRDGTVPNDRYRELDQDQRDESTVRDTRQNATDAQDVNNRDRQDRERDMQRNNGNLDRNQQQHQDMQGRQAHNAARQGLVMWGWDPANDTFDVVWTDDEHSALRKAEGTFEGGKLVLTGKYTDPRDGETYETRNVLEILSPDKHRYTMYTDAGMLSSERKRIEITYTRIMDPSIPMAHAGR